MQITFRDPDCEVHQEMINFSNVTLFLTSSPESSPRHQCRGACGGLPAGAGQRQADRAAAQSPAATGPGRADYKGAKLSTGKSVEYSSIKFWKHVY